MDESSAKKSTSFETLVIRNITNLNELKAKLNDIIKTGPAYDFDVSSCLKRLVISSDQDIVLLSIQAVSELAKSEEKREIYGNKDIVGPILNLLKKEITSDSVELVKQSCRALGNLCADCDSTRDEILSSDGITILTKVLQKSLEMQLEEVQLLAIKTLTNFGIGGKKYSDPIFQSDVVEVLFKILSMEVEKDDFDDDTVSSCLMLLGVIVDNNSELLFKDELNEIVLRILKETTNVDISELCLEHLRTQAEHDSVKLLIAKAGGLQLVCTRLEQLMSQHEAGELTADKSEVEEIVKQACDLVIIVLTGDESMHILYNNGVGEIYITMVKWLDHPNHQFLTTAVLAIGNFARQDDYCIQMMQDNIFNKLLDIFEVYHSFSLQIQKDLSAKHPINQITVYKIEHAVLSSIRNLLVPVANKRTAMVQGRAVNILLKALPSVEDAHVAYKLLAAIRLLVDGQDSIAQQVADDPAALRTISTWALSGDHCGAAGEAPRLLAWTVRQLRHLHCTEIVQVDGCISSLVNMLVASHSLMQNEAILALTLLAIQSLKKTPDNYEMNFTTQLIKSEIGKHVSILVDTNCAKMPVEVAENLLAFLDITAKNNNVALDYKEAKVYESLKKFAEARNDLSPDMKSCVLGVVSAICDNGKE